MSRSDPLSCREVLQRDENQFDLLPFDATGHGKQNRPICIMEGSHPRS